MACFGIAGITAILAFFSSLLGLVDAVLFALIGLGLRKAWRTAAVAGFALYIVEQVAVTMQGRFPGILSILILAILFNGVRASFAYRQMRSANEQLSLPVSSNLVP